VIILSSDASNDTAGFNPRGARLALS